MLIDTHAHLYLDAFEKDIDVVIKRAKEANVGKILFPAIDSESHDAMKKLEEKYPDFIHLMMGLHPCSIKTETVVEELELVYKELQSNNYIAIGEIGIDLHWRQDNLELQKETFRTQIKWAKEMNLPICIHARNSFPEVLEIIEEEKDPNLRGVMHCFTGNEEIAEKFINNNFKLGIGGVVTFKNAGLDKTIKNIDLKHLILETDSPYLSPTPYRGKRNESSYTALVAEKIAEIKQTSIEKVTEITTENGKKLFGLKFTSHYL